METAAEGLRAFSLRRRFYGLTSIEFPVKHGLHPIQTVKHQYSGLVNAVERVTVLCNIHAKARRVKGLLNEQFFAFACSTAAIHLPGCTLNPPLALQCRPSLRSAKSSRMLQSRSAHSLGARRAAFALQRLRRRPVRPRQVHVSNSSFLAEIANYSALMVQMYRYDAAYTNKVAFNPRTENTVFLFFFGWMSGHDAHQGAKRSKNHRPSASHR